MRRRRGTLALWVTRKKRRCRVDVRNVSTLNCRRSGAGFNGAQIGSSRPGIVGSLIFTIVSSSVSGIAPRFLTSFPYADDQSASKFVFVSEESEFCFFLCWRKLQGIHVNYKVNTCHFLNLQDQPGGTQRSEKRVLNCFQNFTA